MNPTGPSNGLLRFEAVKAVASRTPRTFEIPRDKKGIPLKVSEFYGCNTFNLEQMKARLPSDIFKKLQLTIEQGKKLDTTIAAAVALAVKDWAMALGATHFCHWFQPQTGATAEKHDAFLSLDDDSNPIEKFSGSQLIQSEPDASSFPSGGMRTTFEARGYTAWDPSSPVFIMEAGSTKTLCIPSAFISYHGDALDEKTGLLRSMEALSTEATKLLHTMGDTSVKKVTINLGLEQEYFLLDRLFFASRPDLLMSGRTLLGARPPKGQQLEDHYFGSIPARVQAFMSEMEFELFKLGVPLKTRHNEVAPSQYEMAPIFEETNLATDHNQLVMELAKRVAKRHEFEVLLHEKPFAGVNGSGKHCNWSMAAVRGNAGTINLLDPGNTPTQNLRFLLFLVACLKGLKKHSGLLRAGIASSGNDHRLGANEAPPAIISAFLGNMLDHILNELETNPSFDKTYEGTLIKLGASKLPEIAKDNTDRNRTSPFAFTGNKFEFRAVGSSATPAFPVTLLNAAVAEAISELNESLTVKIKGGKARDAAIAEIVREGIIETKSIRFEGNNYSQEWVVEAEKRGLPNLRKTPEALAELITPQSKEVFRKLNIFSEGEVVSRYHVRLEIYVKKLSIEAETLLNMVDTMVAPACAAYYGELASQIASTKDAGLDAPQLTTAKKIGQLLGNLYSNRHALEVALSKVNAASSEEAKAKLLCHDTSKVMEELRTIADELEGLVRDDIWPLPKYREMLLLN